MRYRYVVMTFAITSRILVVVLHVLFVIVRTYAGGIWLRPYMYMYVYLV